MKTLFIILMLLIPVNVQARDYLSEETGSARFPNIVKHFSTYYLTVAYAAQKTINKCNGLNIYVHNFFMQEEESEEQVPFNLKYARDRLLKDIDPAAIETIEDRSLASVDQLLIEIEHDIIKTPAKTAESWCRVVAPQIVKTLLKYYNESRTGESENSAFKEYIDVKDRYFRALLDLELTRRKN